jgi:hypothetical protein
MFTSLGCLTRDICILICSFAWIQISLGIVQAASMVVLSFSAHFVVQLFIYLATCWFTIILGASKVEIMWICTLERHVRLIVKTTKSLVIQVLCLTIIQTVTIVFCWSQTCDQDRTLAVFCLQCYQDQIHATDVLSCWQWQFPPIKQWDEKTLKKNETIWGEVKWKIEWKRKVQSASESWI